jgi:imidazole glycerol-phosphate synthase subunit HisH
MIGILDYGAGNLRSVENTLTELGSQYTIVRDGDELRRASKIVLPGVGHFGHMMRMLDQMNTRAALTDCIRRSVPFLGICLGLQALFERSEEAPEVPGLGLFSGQVKRFPAEARVPHMGWNELEPAGLGRLLAGVPRPAYVYFAHSYYVPLTSGTSASCSYGVSYTALLEAGNTFGVQFHPEKSGSVGLQIMRNFLDL